jgi:hypothetical protein
MAPLELVFLLVAGVMGGALNAAAGGGSLITFPALMAVGIPPVAANATNTFASWPGYVASAWSYRRHLAGHRQSLLRFSLLSLVGGLAGALLLVSTPDGVFEAAVPWLMGLATAAFAWGGKITAWLSERGHGAEARPLSYAGLHVGIAGYGGFFNGGLGIVILAYLALAGHDDINEMNALKTVFSSLVAAIAVVAFLAGGLIAWVPGSAVVAGTVAGGWLGAEVAQRIPQQLLRRGVIVYAAGLTAYFFWTVYG